MSQSTEALNEARRHLSEGTTEEVLRAINDEDATVAGVVAGCIPQVAQLVDAAVTSLKAGGRIFYCGAGTSGRLAVADAAECPPTYGVASETVQAVIAGGAGAIVNAAEGCEDDEAAGQKAFSDAGCRAGDVVIGISAAGNAPFVCAFLEKAKEAGCVTGAITNNENTRLSRIADVTVMALTGPEVVSGSTRMKAGTSQKMILNMFSTAVFVRMGYVFGNYMVNMKVSNSKLRRRAVSIVTALTGLDEAGAIALLEQHDFFVRGALESFFQK